MDQVSPKALVAEAVGAFTLIFAGAGAIIVTGAQDLVGIGLAHGLAIAVMISALGHISGGHFNPAVTIGMWVTRRIDSANGVFYVLAQLAGGIVGALALAVTFPDVMRDAVSLGTPALGGGTGFFEGVLIEVILTFFLVLVFFGTAVDRRAHQLGGLAIGLTITLDIFAGGPLTGAAMNPARALGPALVSGTWDDQLVWWIGPIIGGVLAALLYHYLFLGGQDQAEPVPGMESNLLDDQGRGWRPPGGDEPNIRNRT